MRSILTRMHHDGKKRATAVEYALIAAAISVAIIAIVQGLGKHTPSSASPPTTQQAK
jgi:Flp pilus assembly pilin Flp